MGTTIKQDAWFGVGVYGVDRYGVASVIYIPDGLESTSAVGSVAVTGAAVTPIVGVEAFSAVGNVVVSATAVTSISGVEATSFVGSVVVLENEVVSVVGFNLSSFSGSVSVVTTDFDYEAIKDNYERERTVYISGREQRFIFVEGVPRIVYVENSVSVYERSAKVGRQSRQVYINRGTTSQERVVAIEE